MATKTDITIEEKLKQLYALQVIDSQIDQVQVLKGELPMEVNDLEDEIAGLGKRVSKLEGAINDLNVEKTNHENKIKEAEILSERYKKKMDEVKNNREFEALTKELEFQELDIKLSTKKIKATEANIEIKKESLTNAQEKLATKVTDLEAKKVELEKIKEKTDKEEIKLNKKADKQRKAIEERHLKAYDKVRKAYRNGLAVATVQRDSCGGCFNKVPPQIQLEIGMRKKIIACEHCGRVLVDGSLVEK
jgi:predicted  nucleic acid-binding Zn-ribbon protein